PEHPDAKKTTPHPKPQPPTRPPPPTPPSRPVHLHHMRHHPHVDGDWSVGLPMRHPRHIHKHNLHRSPLRTITQTSRMHRHRRQRFPIQEPPRKLRTRHQCPLDTNPETAITNTVKNNATTTTSPNDI